MSGFEPKPEIKRHPELYNAERSTRERNKTNFKLNPPIPLEDPYNYQNTIDPVYPFFIDAPAVLFIGRVGEEPVTANFTIYNASHRSFWFKIKSSSREMFDVRQSCGKLEKGEKVIVSVIFFPNFKTPKPFCEYFNIHALFDNYKYESAYEAFRQLDCLEPLKTRIYAEFIRHNNYGITQAHVNGRLIEMMKSKIEVLNNIRKKEETWQLQKKLKKEKMKNAELKQKEDEAKQKELKGKPEEKQKEEKPQEVEKKPKDPKAAEEKKQSDEIAAEFTSVPVFHEIQLIDTTYKHRQIILDELLLINFNEINETNQLTSSEIQKRLEKMKETKNISVAASIMNWQGTNEHKNRRENRFYKLHVGTKNPKDYVDDVWEDYRKFMKKKNFKTTDTELSKLPFAEKEMRRAWKEAKEEKEKKLEKKKEAKKDDGKGKKNKKGETVKGGKNEEDRMEKKEEEKGKEQEKEEERKEEVKEKEQKEEVKEKEMNEKGNEKKQKEDEKEIEKKEEQKEEVKEKEMKVEEKIKNENEPAPPKQE